MLNKTKHSSVILILAGVIFGVLAMVTQMAIASTFKDTVEVVAPKENIGGFNKLDPSRFELIAWPKSQVPKDAVTSFQEIEGRWSAGVLIKGVPLTEGMIKGTPGKLTPELMSYERLDLRYVPVPADSLNLFGENLQEGDMVDVIGQIGKKEKEAIMVGTEVVVEEVIKTETKIEGVRLRMLIQDAEKLEQVLAEDGKIRFWVTVPGGKTSISLNREIQKGGVQSE
jgi:Flp pilus assembly protein CpaB